jgi:Ku protein
MHRCDKGIAVFLWHSDAANDDVHELRAERLQPQKRRSGRRRKLVERVEMVKGYEFAKDQYVMFSNEEIKALEDANSAAIDIMQFVPLKSVDPVYFAGTYYLAPDKGGAKPYTLLATALRKAGQCGLGRWVSRGKEHIVIAV